MCTLIAGDAFVRELDVSRITLRLVEKEDKKGDQESEGILAKLQGSTLDILQRCLVGFATSNLFKLLLTVDSVQTHGASAERLRWINQQNHCHFEIHTSEDAASSKRKHQ